MDAHRHYHQEVAYRILRDLKRCTGKGLIKNVVTISSLLLLMQIGLASMKIYALLQIIVHFWMAI